MDIIEDSYCYVCICHEDGTRHPSSNHDYNCPLSFIGDGECDNDCKVPEADFDQGDCCKDDWITDGYCDDECNLKVANFDGGDCCTQYIDDSQCNVCICHLDGLRHSACPSYWIGDQFCDDACNNAENNFDDGDCCLEDEDAFDYCSICSCFS